MKDFCLEGRSVLVTGSTRGIGLAIAGAMKEAGAAVVYHGLEETPDPLVDSTRYVRQDLISEGGIDQLIAKSFAIDPNIDTLICNAGSFFDTHFLEITEERYDKTMLLNVKAPFFITQAFAKKLVESGRPGSVVMTASTNGFQPELKSAAYDVSKGAVVMMIRTLAMNLADHGIRVNGIAPGMIRTPLTASLDKNPAKRELYEKKIVLGRIGEVEDCTGTCVFLCSDAARYITGQIITVDGGLTLGQIGKL